MDREKKEVKKPAAKKERNHSRSEVKKDGTVRQDKFKPKLMAGDAMNILIAFHSGEKKAHLAKARSWIKKGYVERVNH